MRGSLWSLCVAAVFAGIFAISAMNSATPSNPVQSTDAVIGILQTTAPVVGLTLFLVGIGATWVIAVSRSSF